MLTLRADGDLSDYKNTSDLQRRIAANAGVDASLVSINVEAGSVIITAIIEVPASTNATAVLDSLHSNLGNTTLASNALGILVEWVLITRTPAPSDIPVWLPVSLGCVGCCFCSLLMMLALARRRRSRRLAKRIPGSGGGDGANRVRSAAQQRELMAAAAVALKSARDIVATSRDDTPSPLPVLQRFASTLQRKGRLGSERWRNGSPLSRHLSNFPTGPVAHQRWLDHNVRHFATTQHELADQEGPPATVACWPDGSYFPRTDSQLPSTESDLPLTSSHFPPTNSDGPPTSSPTAWVQAMAWLSDAIDQLPQTRDSTPATSLVLPYGYSRGALPLTDSRPPHVMGSATNPMRRPGPKAKSRLPMSSKPTEKVSPSDFEDEARAGAAPPVPSACAERPPQDIEMTSPQQLPQESPHVITDEELTIQHAVNDPQCTGEFGGNSEFHPMSLATVGQSTSDLAAQGGAPNGMTIDPQQQRKSKRTGRASGILGFRLVWNDAPNAAAQQDVKGTYGKYEKVKTLGKGSFGTAVLLQHRRTGNFVVSKQVRVQEMPRAELSKVKRKINQPQVKT